METFAINELERSLLSAFSRQVPALAPALRDLRVLDREFSGVGTFTTFAPATVQPTVPDGPIGLECLIEIPGIPNGLLASLAIKGRQVEFLEIVALDSDWDGRHEGFTISACGPNNSFKPKPLRGSA